MSPTMEDLVAWLPFLAAILLAFAAGFAFSRICQGQPLGWPRLRHGRPDVQDRAAPKPL